MSCIEKKSDSTRWRNANMLEAMAGWKKNWERSEPIPKEYSGNGQWFPKQLPTSLCCCAIDMTSMQGSFGVAIMTLAIHISISFIGSRIITKRSGVC
jgi:hypothetical protein